MGGKREDYEEHRLWGWEGGGGSRVHNVRVTWYDIFDVLFFCMGGDGIGGGGRGGGLRVARHRFWGRGGEAGRMGWYTVFFSEWVVAALGYMEGCLGG